MTEGLHWMCDDITGQHILRKVTDTSSTVICGLHPKPTYEYIEYLGMEFFEDKDMFLDWYNQENWWYGGTAPCDVSKQEAVDRMIRMIHGVYI